MPSWKYITPSNGLIQKQAKRWNGDGAEVSHMKPPTLTKANKLAVFFTEREGHVVLLCSSNSENKLLYISCKLMSNSRHRWCMCL